MKPTVMLVGLGDLGSVVLELLAREKQIGRVVVASRNATRGIARCNLARLSATAYFLRIEHDGQDVTEEVRAEELLLGLYPIPPGPVIHFLTAGCTIQLIRAFLSERGVLIHAPGPEGLPGGYPIIVSREALNFAPIEGLTLEEAIAINERSHRFDGIERIKNDGTVVFCSEAAEVLRAELGYECKRLSPGEAEERAKELVSRFQEYARRCGVYLKPSGGAAYALRNQ